MAANAISAAAAAAASDAKNGSVAKHDVAATDEEDELKATLKALLNTDCLTLKSYARSVLMAAKTDNNDNKKAEIKMIENQLFDLARAIQEAGELLFDLPLALITTKICPYLTTRKDWNSFLLVKKSLRNFAKTAPISTFLPPWPALPRPSNSVYLEHVQLEYQYIISPDGQFIAFTEVPAGMYSPYIHIFSRKNGNVANLCSEGPYPFCEIHFKQQHEVVHKANGQETTLEVPVDGSTSITDISGNMMTTTTHVQAVDTYGIYYEWKLFPTRHELLHEHADEPKPKANKWVVPKYGAEGGGDFAAKNSSFSEDGKYLLRGVGDNEIVVQNVSNKGKTVLHYKESKIKQVACFALSPNNKLLALSCAATGSNSGSTILEVCEILQSNTGDGDDLKVGRVISYEDSSDTRSVAPLAFSPDSAKLASMLPGGTDKIAVWDTSKRAMSASSSFFLPLLNTIGNTKVTVAHIYFSASGKHLIIKHVPVKIYGADITLAERYQGNVEIWGIEDNQLLHSFPCRTLEAVSHSLDATGDRTFILMEEREELKPPTGGGAGRESNRCYGPDDLVKTIQVIELDGNGRLLTSICPKKARCAKCSKLEAVLFGKTLLRCTRCKQVAYCSRECQKADWKVHKRTCNIPEVD